MEKLHQDFCVFMLKKNTILQLLYKVGVFLYFYDQQIP